MAVQVTSIKKNDQGQQIKQEIGKYFHYWPWFILSLGISILLSFLYVRYTPKVYNTTAKIKILNKTKGLELPSAAFVFNRSNINLENEIEILRSYRIIERVVDRLDLTVEFLEEGSVRTSVIDRLPFTFEKKIDNFSISSRKTYKIEIKPNGFEISENDNENGILFGNYNTYEESHRLPFEVKHSNLSNIKSDFGKSYLIKFIPMNQATLSLKSRIGVGMVGKGSDLISISYSGESKQKSERIINTLIDVFDQDGINDRKKISERTIEFIDQRFSFLAKELDSIETNKKDFKQTNDLLSIDASASLEINQRTAVEGELFELEKQLLLSRMLKDQLEFDQENFELLPPNVGIQSANVNSFIEQYNRLISQLADYGNAGTNNPNVVAINRQLEDIQKNLQASLRAYDQQLEASKEILERRQNVFATEVAALPLQEKLLNSIERERVIKETLYLFLLQKREEAAINLAITEPSIKVVEYAISQGGEKSPNASKVFIIGILGGLLLPFVVIYVIILLDTKIKGKTDLGSINVNIPLLAELPVVKNRDLVFSDPTDNTAQAEAFRILSSNVNYILPAKNSQGAKVIYCTSTIKGEGKTYTAVNLSLALASLNKKVLLVGADLRNPQIHNYLPNGYNKESFGLSNYLYDDSFDWKSSLISAFDKHPLHKTLLSGSIPPNPAQLLTNGRIKIFMDEAKTMFDFIIVDTAPTILVTDTMLIAGMADATIYMVRADYTDKKLIEFSQELNSSGRIKNMAYVINGVRLSKSYGYSYNYGYSYGYGSKS